MTQSHDRRGDSHLAILLGCLSTIGTPLACFMWTLNGFHSDSNGQVKYRRMIRSRLVHRTYNRLETDICLHAAL